MQDNNYHRLRIGQQIADLRDKAGLTLRQLAEKSGVSYQNICKIENGKYNVSIDLLSKLCDAMGAEINIYSKATE